MIVKDFRYILKRIIIGVGICIVLSLLNNNNVLAYDEEYYKSVSINDGYNNQVGDKYSYNINGYDYIIEYKNNGLFVNNNLVDNSSSYLTRSWFIVGSQDDVNFARLYIINCHTDFFSFNDNNINFDIYPQPIYYVVPRAYNSNYNVCSSGKRFSYTFNKGNLISSDSSGSNYNGSVISWNFTFYGSNTILGYTDFNNNASSVFILSKKDSERIIISKINSLGEQLIYDDNNILTNVRFSPTFENFNTFKYNYQYKIGNNNWLNITSEGVTFNVNQNATIYFRIVNKSNDEVVDSRTYTITQIGLYDSNTDTYKVKYTSENKSVGEETSSTTGFVNEVSVYFEYFPKISNLKYQYQFVEQGNSLSNWENMPNNDYERTYTTDTNGTLYNRILDENDNVLYTSTFNVNSIGNIFVDESSNNNFFNKLQSKFKSSGYGKNIQDIFFLPVKLIQVEHDALLNELCMPFDLGVLFGTHLIMPCIDVRSYVGNNIYYFIDMVFSIVVILGIINFVVSTYNSIVFMETGKFERDKNMIEGRK